MTTHTVIESLAAYEAVRAADPDGPRVWWTTGAAILEALAGRGEEVRSLEDGLPQEDADALARAGYAFTDAMREDLNRLCPWRDYADVGLALAFTLNQCFFVTLYKGLLLGRLVRRAAARGEAVACVGDPGAVGQGGLSMTYGRFDTLYALLAAASGDGGPALFRHELQAEELDRKHRAVVHRKMDLREKLFSLANNTPGAFLFKAWKHMLARRWFPFRQARLRPLVRRKFFLYGDCELLEETFLPLLLRGGSVELLGRLPQAGVAPAGRELPGADGLAAACRNRAQQALRESGVDISPLVDACLDILCNRLRISLGRLCAALDGLTAGYRQVLSRVGKDAWVLTAGLAAVEEKLFYDFCKANGVRVAAFEHGVTLGLSRWTDYADRYYAMRHADVGVYHNALAADQMGRVAPEPTRLVGGLPRVTLGLWPMRAKRRCARRWLGISPGTHVVMYVAELERNNYAYGPHADNDLQYAAKTEGVVRALCAAYPKSQVILKLYPTERYVDTHAFAALARERPNLRIVKDMDFRFIGLAADLLVTSSSQSTLGWVVGAQAPCLFAEFDWAPAHVPGLRMACPAIPGLSALVAMDTARFITRMDPSFVSRLFD